eukprot:SAG31_NODE_2432_length_5706_cov_41.121634_6_plen_131_part_00
MTEAVCLKMKMSPGRQYEMRRACVPAVHGNNTAVPSLIAEQLQALVRDLPAAPPNNAEELGHHGPLLPKQPPCRIEEAILRLVNIHCDSTESAAPVRHQTELYDLFELSVYALSVRTTGVCAPRAHIGQS